jgi:hypothetical protein
MSKNLTRKGLAFGALVALGSTVIAGTPATAAGIDNGYVALADTQEYGNYNMLTTGYISLDGSFAGAAETGGELKFYVEDTSAISVFDVVPEGASDTLTTVDDATAAAGAASLDDDTSLVVSGEGTATATVTFNIDADSGFEVGDVVNVDLAGSYDGTNPINAANLLLLEGDHVLTAVVDTNGSESFSYEINGLAAGLHTYSDTLAEATTLSVVEQTSSAVFDSKADLRLATFGSAGVVGAASPRSTTAATLNNYVVDTNEENVVAGNQAVRFYSTSDTTGGSIKVTAWVDNDNDGVIDSTEYVSPTRTITFVTPANAGYTISQEGVYIGSDAVTAVVTADLNLAEVGAQSLLEVSIDHIDNGSTVAETDATLAFDTTDENLQGSDSDLTNNLAAGDSIRFAVESANVEVGSPATFGVGSLVVAGSTMVVDATANNTEAVIKDADGTGASTANSTVRSKTASVSATYSAFDGTPLDTTADKVVPGVPYTATVTSSAVTTADGVKVNSTVVDGGTETFTGVTDASGQIKLTLTQTAADAADWVQVSLSVQGLATSGVVKFTYADADYDVYNAAGELSSSTDYNQSVKIAGSLAQKYIVADQFGIAPVNGTMVVTATRAAAVARVTTAATWGYQVPVVDGKATVTIVDNGAGTGSDTVTIKALEITGGGALSTEHDSNTYTLSYVSTDADYTPKGVTATLDYDGIDDTATNEDPVAVSAKTLASFDTRATAGKNAPVLETYNVDSDSNDTVDAQLTLSGSVSNAASGLVAGTPVTISAKGLLFAFTTAGSATIYGMDTITVNTNAAGAYSVEVYGDRGGKQTITVTAGAATASASVTFAVGTPAALDLKTTKVAKSGRAVDVVATVTDKYGVASKGSTVSFVTTGAGYLNSASGVTDANGKVSLKLILGSDEKGITTISATTSIAGVDVTKTGYTFTGVSAKITKAATSSAVVKNAAGATVKIVRGTKTTTKTASSNSFKISVKGGSGSVKVYVNGVKVASK